jgi:hypothetical protein
LQTQLAQAQNALIQSQLSQILQAQRELTNKDTKCPPCNYQQTSLGANELFKIEMQQETLKNDIGKLKQEIHNPSSRDLDQVKTLLSTQMNELQLLKQLQNQVQEQMKTQNQTHLLSQTLSNTISQTPKIQTPDANVKNYKEDLNKLEHNLYSEIKDLKSTVLNQKNIECPTKLSIPMAVNNTMSYIDSYGAFL